MGSLRTSRDVVVGPGGRLSAAGLVLVLVAVGCAGGDRTVGDDGAPPEGDTPAAATGEEASGAGTPSTMESSEAFDTVDISLDIQMRAAEPVFGVIKDTERFAGANGLIRDADGLLHVFRNSLNSAPGLVSIDRMVSADDGLTWERGGPVFNSDEVPGAEKSIFINSSAILDDGTWVLWFSQFDGIDAPGFIRRATAPGPDGPWTFDEQPVLGPGPAGSWDGISVGTAIVHRGADGTWHMWFSGIEARRLFDIGYATSPDGLTWTKYDDPATTDRRLDPSDPIIFGNQEWRPGQSSAHQVVPYGDGWLMFWNGLDSGRFRGIAISEDGIHWTPATDNPMFSTAEIAPDAGRVLGSLTFLPDGDSYLALVGSGSPQGTSVYTARFTITGP